MRTLVDLLHADHGYVRIFAGADGYSYELSAYQPQPIADLFERMSGYRCIADACEAAQQQLSAVRQPRRSRPRRPSLVRQKAAADCGLTKVS